LEKEKKKKMPQDDDVAHDEAFMQLTKQQRRTST
jgi:hypothetical protein